MTLDELHRTMWFRHAADGRTRRELVKNSASDTFRLGLSDFASLGMDPLGSRLTGPRAIYTFSNQYM